MDHVHGSCRPRKGRAGWSEINSHFLFFVPQPFTLVTRRNPTLMMRNIPINQKPKPLHVKQIGGPAYLIRHQTRPSAVGPTMSVLQQALQ
jgi:hypothetical protein